MLVALLATAPFSSQARAPLPGAAQVAVTGAKVIALAQDGRGIVLAYDGKGGLRSVAKFAVPHNPSSLAIADVDGDGKPDLIVGHHEEKFATIAFGDSYARTARVEAPGITPHVHGVAAADLDGDGKVDLVFNDMGGRRVLILWGKGDGTFSAPAAAPTGSKGYAYFNVAVAGGRIYVPCWPQPQVAVLRARGREIAQEKIIDLANPAFFVSGDVAVATYSGSIADPSRDGVVLLGSGKILDGGKAPVRLASLEGLIAVAALGGTVKVLGGAADFTVDLPHPEDVALGDLDGDGKADLAVAAGGEVIVFLTR